jgi:hypothetical protein
MKAFERGLKYLCLAVGRADEVEFISTKPLANLLEKPILVVVFQAVERAFNK